MLDVSIIVVAWNVRQLLYNCLKSVYDQTEGIDFEVIYVDNASEDGSVEMVTKEFPKTHIITNEENRGFIKANNQGLEIAKGRYLLLLNSDTVVLDNAIAKTIRFAGVHPEAAVVGCKVLNPDGALQRHCFMFPSVLNMFLSVTYLYKIFPESKFFGRERMTWWNFNDVREVETVSGCFSLVRREAIKQVGLMDDAYFVYGDDIDWCFRFKKNGWKIMFTPDAEVIHYNGQSTKLKPSKFMLQLYGSRLIFMRKYRSKLTFTLACILTALFFFLRVPYWLAMAVVARNEKNNPLQIAKTYLKGGFYCLVDWKKLLMNKEAIKGKL
jgi:GT2 family glycosyltransferase